MKLKLKRLRRSDANISFPKGGKLKTVEEINQAIK
jgi:hypothetical protein